MAKKTNGKPKDDYPNFEVKMTVKEAKVKENRFSVVFSEAAVELPKPERVIAQIATKTVEVETRASTSSPEMGASNDMAGYETN